MTDGEPSVVFGPVPSRRLGRSLGINNIPPKNCTYSCVYCQVGKTSRMTVKRREYVAPATIAAEAAHRVSETRKKGERLDYVTFVPDGEPTLDIHLGDEISSLKWTGVKTAVITNGSLMNREDVREDLSMADLVSVKIDAVSPDIWHAVDRPHGSLLLTEILRGITEFSRHFGGELITETMLIRGVNDTPGEVQRIAQYITELRPLKSYLAIPMRPPAEKKVEPAGEQTLALAYQLFEEQNIGVEHLIGYEGNQFSWTGNIEKDLLSITSVHPMREEAVQEYMRKSGADREDLERLIEEDKLIRVIHRGHVFYLRRFQSVDMLSRRRRNRPA